MMILLKLLVLGLHLVSSVRSFHLSREVTYTIKLRHRMNDRNPPAVERDSLPDRIYRATAGTRPPIYTCARVHCDSYQPEPSGKNYR